MKEMTCIVCPNGCLMTVEGTGSSIKVTGNQCRRGMEFARNELTNPTRTICSTVKTTFPGVPVLPVRVSKDIPKDKIMEVMKEINKVVVTTPLSIGDPIIENVLGLGVDVIATSNMLKEYKERV